MADIAEEVTLDQFQSWQRLIDSELAGGDYTVPLKRSAVLIKADARENFQGSHDPDGNPWPGLARRRVRTGNSDLPLLDEGKLQASLVGRKASIEDITRSRLELGTNLEYASTQQLGAGGAGSSQPPRRPRDAKMLAIPLSRQALKKNPRKSPAIGVPLVLIRRKNKPALLVEMVAGARGKTKGERWIMHYVLVPEVLIPARPFLGFGEKLLLKIDRVFEDWMQELFMRRMR